MAKMDIQMPDDFLTELSHLGKDFDRVAESVLEAGGKVVLDKAKNNLSAVIGSGTEYPSRSTGELENALGLSPAKIGKDGNHDVKVGFSEPRSDGNSNAKIANIIEYGRHGQPPKPFMKPAKSASQSACKEAMRKKFDEEVKDI